MSRKGSVHLPAQRTQRDQRLSSHGFSASELRHANATAPVTREYRGNVRLTPDWRGLVTAQLHGGRVIR